MNKMFTQPTGPVAKQVNKQTIARIFGIKVSEVSYITVGAPVGGYTVLFEQVSQTSWASAGVEGNVISWLIASDTLTLTTDSGVYTLKLATVVNTTALKSASGSSMVGVGKTTLDRTKQANLFEYLSDSDQVALLNNASARINIDQALKDAVTAGVMSLRLPWVKGRYVAGASLATLPTGFELWANFCRKPYTIANDDSFNGTGVTIQVADGAVAPFISSQRMIYRGINFDGVNKKPTLFYSTTSGYQFNGSRVEHCGIYRMAVALGWSGYIATLFAYRNSVSGNGAGVRNTIDSNICHNVFNANDRSVSLLTGANNSDFTGNRFEWSSGENIYVYNAVRNTITGELIDRSGGAGVVVAGEGSLLINGTVIQRNGATLAANDNYSAQVVLVDNGKVQLNGVRTTIGVNDDGSGTLSPSFCVSYIGSGSPEIIASGCDLSGYVVKPENIKINPVAVITGCKGIPDVVTTGSTKVIRSRQVIDSKEASLAATVGATTTIALSIPTDERSGPTQYGAYLTRTLLVECRLSTGGTPDTLSIPIWFKYESGLSIQNRNSKLDATTARIGMDNTATGVIVTWALNSTGDALNVTLTSVDGIQRQNRVTLFPQ